MGESAYQADLRFPIELQKTVALGVYPLIEMLVVGESVQIDQQERWIHTSWLSGMLCRLPAFWTLMASQLMCLGHGKTPAKRLLSWACTS